MAISVAQSSLGFTPSSTTLPAAFSSNTTTGNTIVVVIAINNATTTLVNSVAISAGSATFTKIVGQTPDGGNLTGDLEIWAAANITGGTTPTVTVTANTVIVYGVVWIYELAGMPSTLTTDGTALGNQGAASASLVSGAITTTNGNDIFFGGFFGIAGHTISSGEAGWTTSIGTNLLSQYIIESTAQTNLTSTATNSASGIYNGVIAAFHGVGGVVNLNAQVSIPSGQTLTLLSRNLHGPIILI